MDEIIEIDEENDIVYVTDPEELDPDGNPLVVQYSLAEWQDINSL